MERRQVRLYEHEILQRIGASAVPYRWHSRATPGHLTMGGLGFVFTINRYGIRRRGWTEDEENIIFRINVTEKVSSVQL
jgi:hypothetical protein